MNSQSEKLAVDIRAALGSLNNYAEPVVALVRQLVDRVEKAEARVTELEKGIECAIVWIDGDLREIIRDAGNQICSYNDLYESADKIERLLSEALGQQAEKAGGE